ncbi:neutral amino acid transporter [Orbilia oligospora]|uniref:Neutral amino acid transporter n=1 Tax=Orbilia oligospora TaxID=2813651 RepID=A0A6G1M7Y6_ORBOL|nr:neutral amino acid transporter [Orbilia oligospora]KAF3204786.1 neutral amino acid transporter [Orbilia oligospora]KAF3214430.1 neutral amino acid transporter [Orbilia oligospora]KAF3230563.1 neutral amino acid transporter [Orbilia oligospora]KAF3249068.1 neutral amino acid transporter [Orbilia oligospora]
MASPSRSIPQRPRRESGASSSANGTPSSFARYASTQRLGSPIRGSNLNIVQMGGAPPQNGDGTPMSYLSQALNGPGVGTPPRFGTPSRLAAGTPPRSHTGSPPVESSHPASVSESVDNRNGLENPAVVRRHLVREAVYDGDLGPSRGTLGGAGLDDDSNTDEEFSSLQLQGGDITRQIYQWDAQQRDQARKLRSKSFILPRPDPPDDATDISNIKVPGGFRRNFIRRAVGTSPGPDGRVGTNQPELLTSNFIEFLSIYGHFAGEELEEEEYDSSGALIQDDEEGAPADERTGLLPRDRTAKRPTKSEIAQGKGSVKSAVLLLLKSFVGTGVLFLPKAFKNGGMLFCILLLLAVAGISYWCFVLLVRARNQVNGSFGDIGGVLYGKYMRIAILTSIVISQIGFASAYIVFVSENLQAFILAVSNCKTKIEIHWLILMQMIVFLPFSMIRDISKLGGTALVADAFILLGLIYLYYYDLFEIASKGVADIVHFNPQDWTLFIGTAIFTFEGIGLIIPIQESMKRPEKFPKVLGGVMILITAVFVSAGALGYAAWGSKTKTVVLLNLPQDDKFVNGVQFLYSLAILLSTPLQLFPAIRIMENGLFSKSGKYSNKVKWEKNIFRFFTVIVTALIAWGGADDLDKFVALIGSFACIPLVYMYPPMLHYKAVARTTISKVGDVVIGIFGLGVMIYTTQQTVRSWYDGSGKPPSEGFCNPA